MEKFCTEIGRSLPLTAALALTGGAAAHALGLPLAWMLGAMAATTAGALAGLQLAVPRLLRFAMIAVLGVMLGSAVTPDILSAATGWWLTSLAVPVYLACAASVGVVFCRKVVGLDRTTAFFAAMPGGLSEMTTIGPAFGGQMQPIALIHGARILLVAAAVPLGLAGFGLLPPGAGTPSGAGHALPGMADLAVLLACATLGPLAARVLRLPAAPITGAMLASAAVHGTGLTASAPPAEAVIAAQLVVGAAIGARFTGVTPGAILRLVAASAGLTLLLLAVSLALAAALSALTGLPVPALLIAFAPGGFAEMGMIALGLHIDPAFVAWHHLLRIGLIVAVVPALFRSRLFRGWHAPPS